MKRLLLFVLFMVWGLGSFANSAEISSAMAGNPNFIKFSGPIEEGDLDRLKKVHSETAHPPPPEAPWSRMSILILDSRGGNVNEAMQVGRWMRQKNFGVVLPENSECFSSCVYLLAAGLTRDTILGKVGIHRPYHSSSSGADVGSQISSVLKKSRSYFEEMNIPGNFADAMFSVLPENLEILTEGELRNYRLSQDDMVYKEKNDLAVSEYYGLTRIQYMQRRKAATAEQKENCRQENTSKFLKCVKAYEEKHGLIPVEE